MFDVESAAGAASTLKASNSSLENARYRVSINSDGDVSSIFDKISQQGTALRALAPRDLHDAPRQWPAWNMDWDQVHTTPRAYVSGPAQIRVSENGAARVAVEVTREFEGSKFVPTVRLSAGDAGNRVEFGQAIDWKGLASNVKADFQLTAQNPDATYNWDIGTIERPTRV